MINGLAARNEILQKEIEDLKSKKSSLTSPVKTAKITHIKPVMHTKTVK
jgi:FtsZ-binding cell division protein ZapB